MTDVTAITISDSAELPACRFDYSVLDGSIASDLRSSAFRIRRSGTKITETILDVGRELLKAKEALDHGQFKNWVEAEIRIGLRTAQASMSAARMADATGKSETIALLAPSTVYRISAKSTPTKVMIEVIDRAAAGDIVADSVVVDMIYVAKCRVRELDRKQLEFRRKKRPRRSVGLATLKAPSRSAVCFRITEALAGLSSLPLPADAVSYFKNNTDAVNLVSARLPDVAIWIREFADAWKEIHGDGQ